MLAVLGCGRLFGWVAWWEGLRVERRKAQAQRIIADQGEWRMYDSSREAFRESERVRGMAHAWAEPWATSKLISVLAFGVMIVIAMLGLGLSIGKVLSLRIRSCRSRIKA